MAEGVLFSKTGLICGRIIRRYKRFLADIELADGSVVIVHTTNTGSMKTCWEPGDRVLLEGHDNPKRKLQHTLLACERDGAWVGVETGIPNRVVAAAARRDCLPGLSNLREVRTEVRYGSENSRIDVWARTMESQEVFIEVKNTTLKAGRHALFPDAVTARGTKHLRELQGMARQGHVAAIAFFVHRGDVDRFDAAREIDPGYAEELERASHSGVLVLPMKVAMVATPDPEGTWSLAWDITGLLPWDQRA